MKTPNNPTSGSDLGNALMDAANAKAQPQPQVQAQPAQPQYQPQSQPQYQPQGQPQYQPQQEQPSDKTSRIYGMNTRRTRVFTATSYSENFKVAMDNLNEYTKKREADGFNKNMFVFPLQDPSLICSALLYTQCFQSSGKIYALVYTMMLENTGGSLKPLVGTDPTTGERYEMPNMPGSQYDDLYWRKVSEVVGNKLGSGVQVYEAGATMVKSEMDWTSELAISRLLSTAENACVTYMNRLSEYSLEPPLNLKEDINPNIDRISANFNFNPQPYYAPDGNPVRNDVEIKLMASADGDMQRQGSEPIVVTRGFVELLSAGPQRQYIPSMMGPVLDTHIYYPQFVITNHDSGIFDAQGPELTALAVFVATLIIENNNWMNQFMPKMVSGVDFNDIGAVNYDLKLGVDPNDPQSRAQRINTKDHNFGAPQLQQLLFTSCHPTMTIAMDIEETGINTWQDAMFLQAGGVPGGNVASLSPDGQSAHRAIIEAFDNMTGGAFSRHFQDQTKLITVRDGTRIPGGYYVDKEALLRDNRNVDLLAVLNLCGEQDPYVVDEFKMVTTSTSGLSVPKRVMLRNSRLANLLGQTYVQKCYYERIVFTPESIVALRAAVFEAGLVIRPENMNSQYQLNSYAAPIAAQYGISTNMASSLVPGGYGYDQQGRVVQYGGFRTGPFGAFHG